MKEFLGRILEPGETLIWRDPPLQYSWIVALLYPIGPVLGAVMSDLQGIKPRDPRFFSDMVWIFTVMGLFYAAAIIISSRWKIAVTDRRVMQRKGFWRIGYEEMPRDAIEDAKNDIPTVILRGSGREMRLDAGGNAHYLHALLTGTEDGKTAAKLLPGESVTMRMPGRWRPWRVMVTDRRVIHRLSSYPTRILQMRLDEIEDVRRDTVFHAVLLRGAGRELAIRLGAAETAHLLDALNRPPWDDLPLAGKGKPL